MGIEFISRRNEYANNVADVALGQVGAPVFVDVRQCVYVVLCCKETPRDNCAPTDIVVARLCPNDVAIKSYNVGHGVVDPMYDWVYVLQGLGDLLWGEPDERKAQYST